MKRILKIKKRISQILLFTISISLYSIFGCNNDETNPVNPTSTLQTTSVRGSINTSEIGGNNLKVQSLYKLNCQVSNSQFSTDVSRVGVQLLLVTDDNNKIRGISISKLNNGNPEIMVFDALSCAYSLLLLSPGLTTSVNDTAINRMNRLSQLSSFNSLVNFLRTNLINISLSQLIQQQELNDLNKTCLYEYFGYNNFSNGNKIQNFDPDIYFSANRKSSDTVEFTNYNWRYVQVLRRDFKYDLSERSVSSVNSNMGGGRALSFGSLIAWTINNFQALPSKSLDVTVQYPDVHKSEYWALGWGKKPSEPVPESLITLADRTIPVIFSTAFYFIFPLIDIFGGGANLFYGTFDETESNFLKIASEIKDITEVRNSINDLLKCDPDVITIANSLIDIVEKIGGAILSNNAYAVALFGTNAALVQTFWGVIVFSFGFSNFVVAATKMTETPENSKYTIGSYTPVLLAPLDNSLNQSLTPILSCYPIYDGASNYRFQISTSQNLNTITLDQNSTSSQFQVPPSILTGSTKYYWRVKATIYGSGIVSKWSEVWSFSTQSTGGAPGPIAYYPFNGNANDSSGNGYNGTPINNPSYTIDRFNNLNKSLLLNGTNQYISLPASINIPRDISISFWIKTLASDPDPWPSGMFIIDRDIGYFARDWSVTMGLGGKLMFNTGLTNKDSVLISTVNINDNNWKHIVVIRDGNNLQKKIFINGVINNSIGFDNVSFSNNSRNIYAGASVYNTSTHNYCNGIVDDIRIYNRALSDNEIQTLYHEGGW